MQHICKKLNTIMIINILVDNLQPKDGKGKKNKQDDIELFELPRTRSVLGSCQVTLASLLEGELEVQEECMCGGGEETGDSDKKEEGPGTKSDAGDKKKPSKGQFMVAGNCHLLQRHKLVNFRFILFLFSKQSIFIIQ